jgi:hypothetical protein
VAFLHTFRRALAATVPVPTDKLSVWELCVTALCLMYKCGKCSRNFASPDELKNHEIPCRGKRTATELALLIRDWTRKDLTDNFPEGQTSEFERSFQSSRL